MKKRNIKLSIEYSGTEYCGWQSQESVRTIQDEITSAISKTIGENVTLTGAGRTDSGVHALGQVANFHTTSELPSGQFRQALNFYLPDDIRIWESIEVDSSFHARYDAKYRRYRYLIGSTQSALYRRQRWHCPDLEVDLLKEAAEMIVGSHDFSAFCVVASRKENNECMIDHSKWRQVGPLLVFEIRGNRFLHSMVRSLVGGMVNLARCAVDRNPQNLTLEKFRDIIDAPDGVRNNFTAPAHGLYLVSVGY